MSRRLRPVRAGFGGVLAAATLSSFLTAAPADTLSTPSRRHFASSSGRVAVVGVTSTEAMPWLRWAEGVASRFDHFLQPEAPAPIPPGVIELQVVAADRAPGWLRWDTAGLGKTWKGILIVPATGVGKEEGEEALCALLLAQEVNARWTRTAPPGRPAAIPEWLSVGLAENLVAQWRSRNRLLLRSDHPPTLAEVLDWHVVPQGWYEPRAWCGWALAWWLDTVPRRGGLDALLDRLAAGGALTPDWLAASAGFKFSAAMEPSWRGWLAAQQDVARDLGEVSIVLLVQLDRALSIPVGEGLDPAAATALGDGRPQTLAKAAKLPLWLRQMAKARAETLRALAAGKGPEFVAVAEQYALFFETVAGARPRFLRRWRLAHAERAFCDLRALTAARERYLDDIERRLPGETPPATLGAGPSPQDVLEKDAIELYLDGVERNVAK